MIKPRTLKAIQVGFDEEKIAFFPRMASQAEKDEVDMQLAEAEAETLSKYQRLFEIKRDAIAAWSVEPPKRIEKVKGENKLSPLVEKVENAPDATRQFFAERTAENEEVINKTFNAFLNLMKADVSFL